MTRGYLLDLMEIECQKRGMKAALALAEAELNTRHKADLWATSTIVYGLLGLAMISAIFGPLEPANFIGMAIWMAIFSGVRALWRQRAKPLTPSKTNAAAQAGTRPAS